MRAIVLAAGEGTRLRPLTENRPKCLVPLLDRPLLEHQLAVLERCGVDDVVVVTGYRAEQIAALGVATRHNERYDETNMVASLMCAADRLDGGDDVVVTYGDVVYETSVLRALLDTIATTDDELAITVDTAWRHLWEQRMDDPLDDAETMVVRDGLVTELGREPTGYEQIEGQYMGLIGVPAPMAPVLVDTYRALDPGIELDGRDRDGMYMTSFLQYLIDHGTPVRAVEVSGGWLEIDTTEDLATYSALADAGELDEYYRAEEN